MMINDIDVEHLDMLHIVVSMPGINMHYAVSVKAMIHCVTEVLLSPAAAAGCERHDIGRVVRVMFTHSLLHTMESIYEHNKQYDDKEYDDRFFLAIHSLVHTMDGNAQTNKITKCANNELLYSNFRNYATPQFLP